MNITFERATPADAETLVGVQIAAFHDDARLYGVELGGPPGYDSVETTLSRMDDAEFYTILCDGKIVGETIVFIGEEAHNHLGMIAILPEYHNLGIGTRAMQFIEQTFPAARWTLDTPRYAVRNQHFYEKFGYVKVDAFDADGIVLIAYEKRV